MLLCKAVRIRLSNVGTQPQKTCFWPPQDSLMITQHVAEFIQSQHKEQTGNQPTTRAQQDLNCPAVNPPSAPWSPVLHAIHCPGVWCIGAQCIMHSAPNTLHGLADDSYLICDQAWQLIIRKIAQGVGGCKKVASLAAMRICHVACKNHPGSPPPINIPAVLCINTTGEQAPLGYWLLSQITFRFCKSALCSRLQVSLA